MKVARLLTFLFAISPAMLLAAGTTVTVTEKQNHKTVSVKAGQTIKVSLDSNNTTGYGWTVAGKPNAKVLKLKAKHYDTPKGKNSKRPLMGAGSREIWTFSVLGKGKTDLVMHYVSPKDKNPKPARVFKITVSAK
jgi:predicted secreted protein